MKNKNYTILAAVTLIVSAIFFIACSKKETTKTFSDAVQTDTSQTVSSPRKATNISSLQTNEKAIKKQASPEISANSLDKKITPANADNPKNKLVTNADNKNDAPPKLATATPQATLAVANIPRPIAPPKMCNNNWPEVFKCTNLKARKAGIPMERCDIRCEVCKKFFKLCNACEGVPVPRTFPRCP